ncbi:hypothetical protein A7985_06180 [Pseudoalteromonas luteoviolacea]|uniref:Uncharacterized protein n=1 Tax=Pseudoalteromonas luteoviolacea TaxID=43657 RepID=A0A1C0TW27_9GAMM|nr:hypothetical protein A7985_06180 [Pseudoalteromonas luteoviolacea]
MKTDLFNTIEPLVIGSIIVSFMNVLKLSQFLRIVFIVLYSDCYFFYLLNMQYRADRSQHALNKYAEMQQPISYAEVLWSG